MIYRHKFLPGVVAREVTVTENGRVQFDRVDTNSRTFRVFNRFNNFDRVIKTRVYTSAVFVTRYSWPLDRFRRFFEVEA